MKEKCITKSSRYITYHSYKEYVRDDFITDLEQTPLHICNIFDDPGDSLWAFQSMFVEVLNNHAPVEEKRIRSHEPPFMKVSLEKRFVRRHVYLSALNKTEVIKTGTNFVSKEILQQIYGNVQLETISVSAVLVELKIQSSGRQ